MSTQMQSIGNELEMQALEALDAPGFWSGFKTGLTIASIIVASAVAT